MMIVFTACSYVHNTNVARTAYSPSSSLTVYSLSEQVVYLLAGHVDFAFGAGSLEVSIHWTKILAQHLAVWLTRTLSVIIDKDLNNYTVVVSRQRGLSKYVIGT